MKPFNVTAAISRLRPTTFTASHSPDYKTFTVQYILADKAHPLHETQKRRQRARPRDGLWWHVTTTTDLSKSSCVRSWARRRMRNAFIEELKLRGYDDAGKPLPMKPVEPAEPAKPAKPTALLRANTFPAIPNLTGSVRLHVRQPLLSAKFLAVCAEAGALVDLLLSAAASPVERAPKRNTQPVSRRSTKPLVIKPLIAKATSTPPLAPRNKPNAPSFKHLFKRNIPDP